MDDYKVSRLLTIIITLVYILLYYLYELQKTPIVKTLFPSVFTIGAIFKYLHLNNSLCIY